MAKLLSGVWEEICNLIIRPQRCKYDPSIMLGPKLFMLGNKIFERRDFIVENDRKMKLQCSHYMPIDSQRPSKKLPCVIYLHGNCGSRCDALDTVQTLLPYNVTIFAFDFAGSGLSEGEWVSLGYYEVRDVEAVVKYLRKEGRTSKIGIWGRSMGAATSIMYARKDPSIAGIVCDSPFTSLNEVIVDLIKSNQNWVPKGLINVGINVLKRSIAKKAKFDIKKNNPSEYATKASPPALFAAAFGDTFIDIQHSERLYEIYGGEKDIIRFDGDHNSERPEFFYQAVSIFLYNVLISNDKDLVFTDPAKVNENVSGGGDSDDGGSTGSGQGFPKFSSGSSPYGSLKTAQIQIPRALSEENLLDQIELQKVLVVSVKDKMEKTTDPEEMKELENNLKELEEELDKQLTENFFT